MGIFTEKKVVEFKAKIKLKNILKFIKKINEGGIREDDEIIVETTDGDTLILTVIK